MRIAFYSDNFFPEISGISDSIITTGQELLRRGHEVMYVAPFYGKREYRRIETTVSEKETARDERNDLPVLRLPSFRFPGSPTAQSRIALPLGRSISRMRKFKPDIIHTQSPFGTGLEALFASRRLGVPLVGTNHTPIEEFMIYNPIGGKLPQKFVRSLYTWYYNRCILVSAPWAGLLETMRADGLTRESAALPNPIRTDLYTPPSPEQKKALRLHYGFVGPVILYAGRLAPEKHVDVILNALSRLITIFPSLTFVVTGHGIAEEELRALAEHLAITDSVVFTGYVSSENLVELYRVADIFIIMSTAETQCLALMQGFATGLPAIGARAAALPDYLPPDASFIVEPGDDRKVSEYVKTLLQDQALRERMGGAGVAFVKQFSPEKIAAQWEEVYARVLSKKQGSPETETP